MLSGDAAALPIEWQIHEGASRWVGSGFRLRRRSDDRALALPADGLLRRAFCRSPSSSALDLAGGWCRPLLATLGFNFFSSRRCMHDQDRASSPPFVFLVSAFSSAALQSGGRLSC
jgi:hypothetical protein